MTPKAVLFVTEYLRNFNATEAATAAGYSEKTAYSQGSRLLKEPEIQAMVRERLRERIEKIDLTAGVVLDKLKGIAFDYAAKDADRIKALELLGRHLQLFTDININITLAKKAEEYAKLTREQQLELMKAEIVRLEGEVSEKV